MRQRFSGPLGQTLRSALAWCASALQRYGMILLAGSLPIIMGLGAVALFPPARRSSVFIYQENLALFTFWSAFLGGLLLRHGLHPFC